MALEKDKKHKVDKVRSILIYVRSMKTNWMKHHGFLLIIRRQRGNSRPWKKKKNPVDRRFNAEKHVERWRRMLAVGGQVKGIMQCEGY